MMGAIHIRKISSSERKLFLSDDSRRDNETISAKRSPSRSFLSRKDGSSVADFIIIFNYGERTEQKHARIAYTVAFLYNLIKIFAIFHANAVRSVVRMHCA